MTACSVVALWSAEADAQAVAGARANEENEIVVTARKREESLSDVPVSTAALSGDQLEKSNVTDVFEAQYLIPSLLIDKGNGNENFVTIRGAASGTIGVGVEPSTALHIDGVYVSRLTSLNAAFLDLERIEVLRGPQGTLFGRNSIGGSINIISKKPTADPEFRFQGEVGSYGHVLAQGIASGPILGDKILGRIAVQQLNESGYMKNIATGRDYGKVDHFSVRGSVLAEIDASKELILRFDYDRQRDDGQAQKGIGIGQDPADPVDLRLIGAIEPQDYYEVGNDLANYADTDVFGVSAQFDWTMDAMAFRSITGFRDDRSHALTDLDASNVHGADNLVDTKGQQFTQELQLFSRGDKPLEWLLGAFFMKDKSSYSFTQTLNSGHIPEIGIGWLGLGGLDDFVAPNVSSPSTWALISAESQEVRTTSFALFANATYNVTDWLALNGGIRYSKEKKHFSAHAASLFADPSLGPILVDFATLPLTVLPTTVDANRDDANYEESYENFLPSATLSVRPTDDILLYTTYSEGFHSGGVNLRFAQTPLEDAAFKPERAKNYEIGLKTDFFGGRLRANLALYQLDYIDRQVASVYPDPDTGIIRNTTINGVESRGRGLELEVTARLSKELTLSGSAGLLKTKLLKDVRPIDPDNPDLGSEVVDVSDENLTLSSVPEKMFSLVANYRTPLTEKLALDATVTWAWRSRTPVYSNVGGVDIIDPNLAIPSYHLVNAQANVGGVDGDWGIGVYAKNLFNKEYPYALFAGSLAVRRAYVAPPREVGLRVFKSF